MKKTMMKKIVTGVVAAGTILSLLQVPNVLAENEVASSQNEKNVVVKVNKELDIAEGITTPTATFTFKFAPKSGQNSANVPYETVTPTNGTIPNRTVTYNGSDTLPQGKTAITKATDDIFAGVTYENAGEYVYTVSEEQTGWTALANNIDTLTFDTKTYEMHVFVKNKSQGTGTYISNVYFVDTTAGSTTAATAKKAGNAEPGTEGGSKVYKYDLFKNKYTKKAGKTGDSPSTINPNADALTITKKVAGGLASKTKNFTFKLTFKAASTDETGTYTGTKGSEKIQFTKDVEKEFTLHDGESLVFPDLPAGTKYTLKEEGASGYTPSSAYKENGTLKNGSTGTQSQAYTVADVLIGEKENNNIVTNTLPEVTPTGLLIDNLPFIIMIGLGLFGFILVAKRRREAE
ncbi:DUF5979 domain-containing protein [uncultured Granulicatella sp.]|uniref:DUF7601 domain-containing protein n=1 Tax=uncultured Granulicatella sp. TaxID=316089 RepID=UPI0028E913C6|nr:DUF5979 domain-containing protein [uncultured Granulicatella sp.]